MEVSLSSESRGGDGWPPDDSKAMLESAPFVYGSPINSPENSQPLSAPLSVAGPSVRSGDSPGRVGMEFENDHAPPENPEGAGNQDFVDPQAPTVNAVHENPKNFNWLDQLMRKIWSGKFSIDDWRTVTPLEENVLRVLIDALGKPEDIHDELYDKVVSFMNQSEKREEENTKLVVRSVIKKMVDDFNRLPKGSRRAGKIENHLNFLKMFFAEAKSVQNIGFEGYLLPSLTFRHEKKLPIIGKKYLELLRESPRFVEAFCQASEDMEETVLKTHINKKIPNLVDDLFGLYCKDENLDLMKAHLKGKCTKVPWTKCQIRKAFQDVTKYLKGE